MNRRGFLKKIAGGTVGAVVVGSVGGAVPADRCVMDPVVVDYAGDWKWITEREYQEIGFYFARLEMSP